MVASQIKGRFGRSPVHRFTTSSHRPPDWRAYFCRLGVTSSLFLSTWSMAIAPPGRCATSHQTEATSIRKALAVSHWGWSDSPFSSPRSLAEKRVRLVQSPAANGEPPQELLPIQQAPSVVWLIVMPSIPLVGGALIYLTRRWFGTAVIESRILSTPVLEEPSHTEVPSPQAQDLETDLQE